MIALVVGSLVYVVARPAGAQFLPDGWWLGWSPPEGLQIIVGSLPSFCHVLAFGFLSAGLNPSGTTVLAATVAWASINLTFEFAQLTGWLAGRFDPNDCIAALLVPLAVAAIKHRIQGDTNNEQT